MQDGILPDPEPGYQWRPAATERRATCPQWKRNPDLHVLGRAIRELRARCGLSQEALGAVADVHRNYVGAMERGEINPTFRVLLKVASGLGVPFSELAVVYERQKEGLSPYRPAVRAGAAGMSGR